MSAASPTPSSQTWNFPYGPSSRYHQRERPAASQHATSKSAYVSRAPVLSTERRASHRRSHTQSGSISSTNSPPSEYARSPLSRFSSYSAGMRHNGALPSTPAKLHRRNSSVQNSPFSDYFTDDARSEDSSAPATATKQLLVRMNKLQSQLMRDSSSDAGREAIQLVAAKLDEIERAFSHLHTQMSAPSFHVEDSGIFSDEEEVDSKNAHHQRTGSEPFLDTVNGSIELPPEPSTIEEYRAERDWFILRTQELLDGLRFTQSELGQRFAEVRRLNEEHNAQIEERDTQIEQLRSENERLRSDLGFEYSELLFLKLQMKSIEVDVDENSVEFDPTAIAASRERLAKKNRILSEMDRWRSDWQDVNGRFRKRRNRYGVSPERRDSLSADGEAAPASAETEWHLQTVKEGHGRVTSLTIKRMDSTFGSSVEEASGTANELDVKSSHGPTTSTENHQNTNQGPGSEPQIAEPSSPSPKSKMNYVEHATQTEQKHYEDYLPPLSQDEKHDGKDDYDDELFPLEHTQHDETGHSYLGEEAGAESEDCAITSSSEASDVEEEVLVQELQKPAAAATTKTAWQELWESLQNLTGIDDRFED